MAKSFSIFVQIGAKLLPSLNSSITQVDKAFSKLNRSLQVKAIETRTAMKGIADSMKPIAAMAAAGGLSFGFASAIGNSSKLAHEAQMLRNIGLSTGEVAQAFVAANRTMAALPTTTILDNVRALREGVGAFGDFKHAVASLEFNQKVGSMLKNNLGSEFDAGHAIASGIRALEIRGTAMNPGLYQKEMGELYRSMVFFGDRFSPDELAAFAQTGNIPVKGYGLRFLSRILPSLIQEQGGGDVVGTQAAAFRNQILGRVPLGGKKLTEEWVRLGLVPPAGMGGNLSRTGWTPGSVKNSALAMSDPFAWIETTLLPAMARGGVNTSDPNAVLTQVSKMFGRETAVRFVSTMADPRQRNRLHRDEANIGRVSSVGAAYAQSLRNDPLMAWGALKSSFTNLSSVLFGTGKGESPVAVALVKISRGIDEVAATIERHPRLGQALGGLLGFTAAWASLRVAGIGLGFLLGPIGGMFVKAFGAALTSGLPVIANLLTSGMRGAGALAGAASGTAFGAAFSLILKAARFGITVFVAWQIADALAPKIDKAVRGAGLKGFANFMAQNPLNGVIQFGPDAGKNYWTGRREYVKDKGGNWVKAPQTQGKRALGGPVRAGSLYEVGERGREYFMPSVGGRIIPNGAAVTGRAPLNATFHIHGVQDPQAVAAAVDARLRYHARQQDAYLND